MLEEAAIEQVSRFLPSLIELFTGYSTVSMLLWMCQHVHCPDKRAANADSCSHKTSDAMQVMGVSVL